MYTNNPSTRAASQGIKGYLLADPAPSAGNEPAQMRLVFGVEELTGIRVRD